MKKSLYQAKNLSRTALDLLAKIASDVAIDDTQIILKSFG